MALKVKIPSDDFVDFWRADRLGATRPGLLAQIAGAMAAPMQQFASLLNALPQNLAYGLKALIDQQGGPVSSTDEDAAVDEAPVDETGSDAAVDETGSDAAVDEAPADDNDAAADEAPADDNGATADEADADTETAAAEETEEA